MTTSTYPYNLELLRQTLEEQYELHTGQLTELAVDDRDAPWLAPRPVRTTAPEPFDIVDEWGRHSFPASDPPANW